MDSQHALNAKTGKWGDASPVKEIIAQISGLVKTLDYSSLTNIPLSSVHSAVLSNGLMSDSLTEDIIGMVYDYKKKKLIEAEHRGYVEARELYEDKLKNLKQELREEKRKGYTEIQNLVDLMCDVFEEISGIQMEVAGLEILL